MARSASPAARRAKTIGFYGLSALLLFYLLFPFYWAVVTSMKSGTGLFQVDFLPPVNLSNYWGVFAQGPFGLNILNSVIVAVSVVLLSLGIALFASYALGRIRFRGRAALLLLVLGVSMFPQVAVLSGMFELVRALGIYNRLTSLILAYMIFTLPFTVWVLTTFMRELPRELEEAALVDGAAPWQVLFKIFLPIMGPALVTTGLLAFIAAWNEFLFAITFILNPDVRTVPVAIALISGASQYDLPFGTIMAASIIVTLPLIVLVLIFQRLIVSGLTAGAVKG
ncbi:carbohydrate ABC transporter permease [Radicibacter daui]|uniref:carbohydrate ABC transporter permease n=1 Tax=Radicibacter daui TaxID=3064829 RepID=UPI004046ED65